MVVMVDIHQIFKNVFLYTHIQKCIIISIGNFELVLHFHKSRCMTFSFVNGSLQCTVIVVTASCKCPANACVVSLRVQWNKWYLVQVQCEHCRRAVMTRLRRIVISIDSLRSLCKCHHLQRYSCCDHTYASPLCAHGVLVVLGDLTALLLRTYGVLTSLI